MKKYLLLFLSILTVAGVGTLSSCESEDPPPNPKVNFARATRTLSESAGTLEVEVTLDRASDKSIVIGYDIDGDAEEGDDYEIPVDIGEVEIPAGSTTGVFEIVITNDTKFEGNETIELRISDAPDNVEVGEEDEMVITITEDDSKPVANFVVTSMNVNEANGLLELEVELSSEAGQDLIVNYELSGTAIDSLTGWEEETGSDYFIDGASGELEIVEGESSGTIRLQLYTDFLIENAETIIITIQDGETVLAGTKDVLTISLKQQDGRAIVLDWDPAFDEVDMDLFVWFGDLGSDPEDLSTASFLWSIAASTEGPEIVFIPDNLPELFSDGATEDATFGMSYTYWGGEESPMTFDVQFVDIVNGVAEAAGARDNYSATYTLVNINEWDNDVTGTNPIIVQTFDKDNGAYLNISNIAVPNEGSRVRTSPLPPNSQKKTVRSPVFY